MPRKNRRFLTIIPVITVLLVGGLRGSQAKPCGPDWAEGIVTTHYAHGFPQAEIFALGCTISPEVADRIKTLRHNPNLKASWQNAILLEGILGDVEAWPQLKAYLEAKHAEYYENGSLPIELYRAKLSVLQASGMLLYRASETPVGNSIYWYLRSGTRPGEWNKRLQWRSPYDDESSTEARNLDLSEASIRALGISGTPTVNHYLVDLNLALQQVEFSQDDQAKFPKFLREQQWVSSDLTPDSRATLQSATLESSFVAQKVGGSSLKHYFISLRR